MFILPYSSDVSKHSIVWGRLWLRHVAVCKQFVNGQSYTWVYSYIFDCILYCDNVWAKNLSVYCALVMFVQSIFFLLLVIYFYTLIYKLLLLYRRTGRSTAIQVLRPARHVSCQQGQRWRRQSSWHGWIDRRRFPGWIGSTLLQSGGQYDFGRGYGWRLTCVWRALGCKLESGTD